MSNTVMLNPVEHRTLRISTQRGKSYGDAIKGTLVFPAEFILAHKDYPIYFQKSKETGAFQSVAIFGFDEGENLFLNKGRWEANYIPAIIRREPFMIGLQKGDAVQKNQGEPVLLIDMDSPRISTDGKGESVFQEDGSHTAYLEEVNQTLSLIHKGFASEKALFETLLSLDLLEPFVLDVKFNDGSTFKADAFFTINQEKLNALDDAAIGQLHRSGVLQLIYMVLASLSNIRALIDKKNLKSAN